MSNLKLKSAFVFTLLSAQLVVPFPVISAVPDYTANTNQLVAYLKANQDASGKITGFGGETSWTIMGLVAVGIDPATVEKAGNSLLDFLAATPPADSATTAWERDLLAVTAAGENPFSFGGRNYVAKVESFANSGQIGSTSTLNDDIFGIMALISAGPTANQGIISSSVDFLISNQNSNGGWSWQVGSDSDSNDTAVAIQALKAAKGKGFSNTGITTAINSAATYLTGLQQADGGWEYQSGFGTDGASTAWVVQALIGNDTAVTAGLNFLAGLQDNSGGVQFQTGSGADTFTSGYALSAFSQKAFPVGEFSGSVEEPSPQPQPPPAENPNQNDNDQPETPASTASDDEGEVLAESTNNGQQINNPQVLPVTGPSYFLGLLLVPVILGLGLRKLEKCIKLK